MSRRLLLGVLAWLAQPIGAWAEPSPLRFSHPDGPDRAEIELRSSGCFHRTSTSIVVFRNPASARVTGEEGEDWVPLSIEDLSGLDRLLDFYRGKPRGGCTTVDEVTVAWFRGRERLVTERFEDGSCLTLAPSRESLDSLAPRDREAVIGITITLGELVRRAAE